MLGHMKKYFSSLMGPRARIRDAPRCSSNSKIKIGPRNPFAIILPGLDLRQSFFLANRASIHSDATKSRFDACKEKSPAPLKPKSFFSPTDWTGEDFHNWFRNIGVSSASIAKIPPELIENESKLFDWKIVKTELKRRDVDALDILRIESKLEEFRTVRSLIAPARKAHAIQKIATIRNDPTFSTLKASDSMQQSHRKFIAVPPLGNILNVKGYDSPNQHLFVSDTCLQIWETYYKTSQNPAERLKLVPSGPHGVGKSGIGLLLASTAFMLKKPLLYYPHIPITQFNKKEVLNSIYMLNADLLDEIPELELVFRHFTTDSSMYAPIKELSLLDGAVFIMDEHNTFFSDAKCMRKFADFLDFLPFHSFNLCMFIGSAHSKFESTIKDAYKSTLFYLAPFSWEEFLAYISEPNSPMSNFPLDTVPGTSVVEKQRLIYETFKLYHLIGELHGSLTHKMQPKSFLEVAEAQAAAYKLWLKHAIEMHGKPFAALILSLCKNGTGQHYHFTDVLHDGGLIYKKGNKMFPANLLVQTACNHFAVGGQIKCMFKS